MRASVFVGDGADGDFLHASTIEVERNRGGLPVAAIEGEDGEGVGAVGREDEYLRSCGRGVAIGEGLSDGTAEVGRGGERGEDAPDVDGHGGEFVGEGLLQGFYILGVGLGGESLVGDRGGDLLGACKDGGFGVAAGAGVDVDGDIFGIGVADDGDTVDGGFVLQSLIADAAIDKGSANGCGERIRLSNELVEDGDDSRPGHAFIELLYWHNVL